MLKSHREKKKSLGRENAGRRGVQSHLQSCQDVPTTRSYIIQRKAIPRVSGTRPMQAVKVDERKK